MNQRVKNPRKKSEIYMLCLRWDMLKFSSDLVDMTVSSFLQTRICLVRLLPDCLYGWGHFYMQFSFHVSVYYSVFKGHLTHALPFMKTPHIHHLPRMPPELFWLMVVTGLQDIAFFITYFLWWQELHFRPALLWNQLYVLREMF